MFRSSPRFCGWLAENFETLTDQQPLTSKVDRTSAKDSFLKADVALEDERYSWFYLFGRLEPEVSVDQAQGAMKLLHRQLQEVRGD